MGQNHLRVLSEMAPVQELHLFDPRINSGDLVPHRKHLMKSSLDKFLEVDLDYCVLSSPTSTHLSLALELANRRIPTLIEKPIANSVTEGSAILETYSSQNLLGAVGHVERYNPAIIALKRKLDEGLIGKVIQISTRRVGPYSGRIRDVGVVKDLATHDIHLVQWLTGQKYVDVDSRISCQSNSLHEDAVLAIGLLSGGIIVSHEINWISPKKERVTTVQGESGVLIADTLTGKLDFHENLSPVSVTDEPNSFRGVSEGPLVEIEIAYIEPLVTEHLAFQEALLNGNTTRIVNLRDALEVLSVAESILENAKR